MTKYKKFHLTLKKEIDKVSAWTWQITKNISEKNSAKALPGLCAMAVGGTQIPLAALNDFA